MMSASSPVKASWSVIGMLAAAQFIMVLDTTVMNVSITQVVEDLDTTVVGLQSAITVYTLVMAALMLLGGKLGDRWGAKRAFAIGMVVYGIGSLTTALAPNLQTLLVGWSLVEGMGAALVIPAIAALTAATYEGRQRAMAYGILGGVTGASAAAGPLIGGWVGTQWSWRYVFAGETVVVVILVLMLGLIPHTAGRVARLDVGGAFLSAAALGLAVFGVLRSSQWGWVLPGPKVPTIGDWVVAPLGLSPTLWLIVVGCGLLVVFARYEVRLRDAGREPLVDMALFRNVPLRAGLVMIFCQQFIVMGTFLVIPMYLQTVLGFDSLKTGTTILPLSISLLVAALGGSALTGRFTARRIVQVGVLLMLFGEVTMLAFIDPELRSAGFSTALILVGAGMGLLASQIGNVIMSSVSSRRGGEAGGLQGTAQNLGASLGTALVGSVLIAVLASTFQSGVLQSPDVPDAVKVEAASALEASGNFLSVDQVAAAAETAGLSGPETAAITEVYSQSQLLALRQAIASIAIFALIALAYLGQLPRRMRAATNDAGTALPDSEL